MTIHVKRVASNVSNAEFCRFLNEVKKLRFIRSLKEFFPLEKSKGKKKVLNSSDKKVFESIR